MASTKSAPKKELAKPDTFDHKTRLAFDWTQFTLKIFVKASPQTVWKAWTDPQMLSSWFPVKGIIEPKAGGRIWLQFFRPEDTLDDIVISAVKGKKVVFPFGNHGEQVEVKVISHKGGTICQLTQSRMRTTARDKVYMHMGCRAGWVFFLTNLKAYLEHGLDLRSTDPKMTYREGFVNS